MSTAKRKEKVRAVHVGVGNKEIVTAPTGETGEEMAAKRIMIQGTMSNSGKSFLVAALCRIFRQDGYRTAPFKSQNMALNSYVTKEGLEIGRAQAMQAEAAGICPVVDMNPILLKPTSHMGSQVILKGEVAGNWRAMDYYQRKAEFIPLIREAFQRLEEQFEVIVLEGAGSPAEINLKENDIVNMGMAELADAPVLLVGDIDRGGVFASLYGTVMLLEPEERARIKGLVINKFCGDPEILKPGLEMIEERLGIPVVGVIPLEKIDLDDEDSLSGRLNRIGQRQKAAGEKEAIPECYGDAPKRERDTEFLDVAVIRLPHISNFTDFTIWERKPGVFFRYVERTEWLGEPDLLILPGTKNTMSDLSWLRQTGLEAAIRKLAAGQRTYIIGICGGYQMLGNRLQDPDGVEGPAGGSLQGIGLLPASTLFTKKKTRTQITGLLTEESRMFRGYSGGLLTGYEIHMGETVLDEPENAGEKQDNFQKEIWKEKNRREGNDQRQEENGAVKDHSRMVIRLADGREDGMEREDGRVLGSYLHGLFDNEELTDTLIQRMMENRGILFSQTSKDETRESPEEYKERQYDRLADLVRNSLDMKRIYEILEKSAAGEKDQ